MNAPSYKPLPIIWLIIGSLLIIAGIAASIWFYLHMNDSRAAASPIDNLIAAQKAENDKLAADIARAQQANDNFTCPTAAASQQL